MRSSASCTAPARRSRRRWRGAARRRVRRRPSRHDREGLEVVRSRTGRGERGALRRARRARRRAVRRRGRPLGGQARACSVSSATRCRPPASDPGTRRGRPCPGRRAARRGPLNVNADEAAAALAIGLGAERILFVTDVARALLMEGAVVREIGVGAADLLLDGGSLEGGIVPKLRAAVTAARLGVRAEIGLDGGGCMTNGAGRSDAPPDVRAPERDVHARRGLVALRRGRQPLPRPRRGHRRRRARASPPGPARRRARAARRALARLEPLLDRADGRARSGSPTGSAAARRSSATRARRRSRRRSSGRARRPAGPRSSRSRARSTGARSARSPRPASRRSAAFEPLLPGRLVRAAERRRVARRGRAGEHRRDPARAGPGRRRRPSGDPGVHDGRPPARRRARLDADRRRGADGRRAHGHVLRVRAARRPPGRGDAREGPRERPADRRAARRRRRSAPASSPATTRRRSAATRSRARPRARSSRRSTTTCSHSVRATQQLLGREPFRRGPRPRAAARVRRRPPGRQVVERALEQGVLVGTAGPSARCA